MATVDSIHVLAQRGWPQRRIARELGIDRETVARHLKIGPPGAKPANATAGSPDGGGAAGTACGAALQSAAVASPATVTTGTDDRAGQVTAGDVDAAEMGADCVGERPSVSNPAIGVTSGGDVVSNPAKVSAGAQSRCRGFEGAILEGLGRGLDARRIWQDLVDGHGFGGSYESVKRFVRQAREREPQRVWRLECAPGEEAQVDFGLGAPVLDAGGRRRRTWVFRIVLSCSRKGYSEAVLHQDTETFIRCIENAFRHFGGVPALLNVDNLKAAVLRADWHDPDLNPKLAAFCRHYGTVLQPSRPYRPQDKGKIEAGIKFVRHNALQARHFESLAAQNAHLRHWEEQVADRRIHGTTRQQVQQHFLSVEKAALRPLPIDLFPAYLEGMRRVHRDSFVEVAKAYYEVPEQYIRREVWARWDARQVRIHALDGAHIITHLRLEPGQFTRTLGCAGRSQSVDAALGYWQNKARELGGNCALWAAAVAREREGPALRVIQGLCSLARKHRPADIDAACQAALGRSQLRLDDIRRQLSLRSEQLPLDLAQEHPVIRPMADYAAIAGNPFTTNTQAVAANQ